MKKVLILLTIGLFIFLYRDGFCFSKMKYNENQVIENTLKHMIFKKIDEDKKVRTLYWLSQGKTENVIMKKLALLKSQYRREKEKIIKYCKNNTKYCEVNNNPHELYYEGRKFEIQINYFFDKSSKVFFNQVPFVYKNIFVDKNKLYRFEFTGITSLGLTDVCSQNSITDKGSSISMGDINYNASVGEDGEYLHSTILESSVSIGTIEGSLDKKIYVKFTAVTETKK